MARLLLVLSVGLLLASAHVFGNVTPDEVVDEMEVASRFQITREHARTAIGYSNSVRRDIKSRGLEAVAYHSDRALDALIARATQKLAEHGDGEYAYWKQAEWKREYSGYLSKSFSERHIGDHKTEMLSLWLENFYDHLELVLSVDLCKMFHLSDIKTINCCVKVCFKPCTFAMDSVSVSREEEYRNHFAKDIGGLGELYGLVPVVTYWVTDLALMASGIGMVATMIIPPAAEFVMGKWLAPRLSDWIWERQCL